MTRPLTANDTAQREEYVTIIADTVAEVMSQFSSRALSADGYSIVGPIGRHSFSHAGGAGAMFGGQPMFAATFMRRVPETH
jgi:hypothetical protein